MKIVMIAGGGGSGGLKGYLKGFLGAADVEMEEKINISVICTKELADTLYGKIASNVTLIPMKEAEIKLKDCVKNKPLHPAVLSCIEKERPDVIYFPNSIIYKGCERYPIVLEMHNQLYVDSRQFWRQRLTKTTCSLLIQRHFARKSMKYADLVIFDSKQSKTQCMNAGFKIKDSFVTYFGVEDSEREYRECTNLVRNPIRFVYISTIFPYKNQIPLLRGMAELKKRGCLFQLDLVGSGPKRYMHDLKREIIHLELEKEICLHNWVEHEKVKEMIDRSDIFIYASAIETSGFGLMEGMVRGAVIACNKESCMPEILQDGGVLFDVYSPNDVADTIQKLLKDRNLRKECARKAYEISLKYTWPNHDRAIFQKLIDWLKN